jgi:hypothetical protein
MFNWGTRMQWKKSFLSSIQMVHWCVLVHYGYFAPMLGGYHDNWLRPIIMHGTLINNILSDHCVQPLRTTGSLGYEIQLL